MSLVIPILAGAVVIGLMVKQITPRVWALMLAWIGAVCFYYYFKQHLPPPQ